MVLHLRVCAPGFWDEAKCRDQVRRLPGDDMVYDPFFPEDELGHHDIRAEQDAVDFCNGTIDGFQCPVRDACLEFGATNNERHGVWGGMTADDRKVMRKLWPWRGGKIPRPEWRWFSHEEIRRLLDAKISSGEISVKQVEEDDDEEE